VDPGGRWQGAEKPLVLGVLGLFGNAASGHLGRGEPCLLRLDGH
jgi:hypothetical protein